MGGVEKGGGWKTSRMTPLPKGGFGPPLVRYVFHPPQASALCFSCTKIHDRADQKLFWRGPKIFGRAHSLVRFPPPIRFAPLHITAQYKRITLQSKFLGLFSFKKGPASGSNITKKIFWWNYFCNNYKDYYKRNCSKELFCNHFGQDGTFEITCCWGFVFELNVQSPLCRWHRSEKLQNVKSSNSSNFRPESCRESSPNFPQFVFGVPQMGVYGMGV